MTLQEIINKANGEVKEMLIAYQKEMVINAVKALSYNELSAVKAVFEDKKIEKTFSAKEVATSNNITRSILVTAMDKLQVAGLITQKSLGCKGCYVKVLNESLFDVVERA